LPVGIAIGGAAVVGGATTLASGSKAAKAQKKAADQQVAESRRQYDQDRADLAPWRQTGASALERLSREYGLSPTERGGPDSEFIASPGYEFRRDEGLRAIDRSNSARGLLTSGAADKARMRYAEGLGASEYDSYWNRLAGLAGVGQSATTTGIAAGQNSTGQINNAYREAGNARASSYANTGSAINSGINNVLSAYLYQRGGGFGGGR
jgi:hypothetical protein